MLASSLVIKEWVHGDALSTDIVKLDWSVLLMPRLEGAKYKRLVLEVLNLDIKVMPHAKINSENGYGSILEVLYDKRGNVLIICINT